MSRIRSGNFKPAEARKNIDHSVEKDSIIEERSIDVADAPIKSVRATLTRQQVLTKKSPRAAKKLSENGSGSIPVNGAQNPNNDLETEKREIPGRRKPRQPELGKQWQDSKCNSIDEDDEDDRFFTAVES